MIGLALCALHLCSGTAKVPLLGSEDLVHSKISAMCQDDEIFSRASL